MSRSPQKIICPGTTDGKKRDPPVRSFTSPAVLSSSNGGGGGNSLARHDTEPIAQVEDDNRLQSGDTIPFIEATEAQVLARSELIVKVPQPHLVKIQPSTQKEHEQDIADACRKELRGKCEEVETTES